VTWDALSPRRASLPDLLLLDPNHACPNRSALSLGIFQSRPLCLFFRLERLRQRRELTADVLIEQPLLDIFGHLKFIAQVAVAFDIPKCRIAREMEEAPSAY